ncbi:hypothetical protein BGZ54_005600, partial [Gamsiella multidivaricata]
MLGYDSALTLWRPISKYLVLKYKLNDVCQLLGLTRTQPTALAVVSSNDYNRNIYSLGPATNFSIIKSLDAPNTEAIVAAYLNHVKVSTKNTTNGDFHVSLRVFVDKKQTLVSQTSTPAGPSFNDLWDRFRDLCSCYEQLKKSRPPQR